MQDELVEKTKKIYGEEVAWERAFTWEEDTFQLFSAAAEAWR